MTTVLINETFANLTNWFNNANGTVSGGVLSIVGDGQLICQTPLSAGPIFLRVILHNGNTNTNNNTITISSDGTPGTCLGACFINNGTHLVLATLDKYLTYSSWQSDSSGSTLADPGVAAAADIQVGIVYDRKTKDIRLWVSNALKAIPDSPTSWNGVAPMATYNFAAQAPTYADFGNFVGLGCDTASTPHPQYGAFTAGDFTNMPVVSGTLSGSGVAAVRAGGKTIVLTMTDDTFVAAGATFDAVRQDILNGLVANTSESAGWNAQLASIGVSAVVRTSSTVVTITLPAFPGYMTSLGETITATVPASARVSGAFAIATPSILIARETIPGGIIRMAVNQRV